MRKLINKFRVVGKLEKLSAELIHKLDLFELVAFVSARPGIEAVAFSLGAIREENMAVHNYQRKGSSELSDAIDLAQFVIMNYHYQKGSAHEDSFEDLFYLRGIVRSADALITKYGDQLVHTGSSAHVSGKKMRQIMLRMVINPDVLDNYHDLIRLHGSEGEKEELKSLSVIDALFRRLTRSGGGIDRLSGIVGKMVNQAAYESVDVDAFPYSSIINTNTKTEWLGQIFLDRNQYSYQMLVTYFPLYYRLAKNRPKKGMLKGVAFEIAREKLRKMVVYLEGDPNVDEKGMKILRCLKAVITSDKPSIFPSSKELDKLVVDINKYYSLSFEEKQSDYNKRFHIEVCSARKCWVQKLLEATNQTQGLTGELLKVVGALAKDAVVALATAPFHNVMSIFESLIVERDANDALLPTASECDVLTLQNRDQDIADRLQAAVNECFDEGTSLISERVERFDHQDGAFIHLNESLDEYEGRELKQRHFLKDRNRLEQLAGELRCELVAENKEARQKIEKALFPSQQMSPQEKAEMLARSEIN
ncbi:MAG: hypothetical protein P0S94_00435, partial [Simkaniaceae bacterium]|nr:hypothetical protein [Simkaniaceae bacterium]